MYRSTSIEVTYAFWTTLKEKFARNRKKERISKENEKKLSLRHKIIYSLIAGRRSSISFSWTDDLLIFVILSHRDKSKAPCSVFWHIYLSAKMKSSDHVKGEQKLVDTCTQSICFAYFIRAFSHIRHTEDRQLGHAKKTYLWLYLGFDYRIRCCTRWLR